MLTFGILPTSVVQQYLGGHEVTVKWRLLIIVLLSIFMLAGCGQTVLSQEEEATILRLGHIQNEGHSYHLASVKFADLVEEKTNGKVKIDIYPSSTLGTERDLIEGLQIGSVDFALASGVMANFHPPYAMLELPYLFDDTAHLQRFLYSEYGEELQKEMLKQTGVRGLEFWTLRPRQLTSNKLVESPADLKGLKMRVPDMAPLIDGWNALGANATPMSFNEVYSGLQTGVIDAQENPISFSVSANLHDVQSYLIKTNHVYGYIQLLMSDLTYEKLSDAERIAIEEAALEARTFQNELVIDEEEEALQKMIDSGVEVIEVEMELFRELLEPLHKSYAEQYGEELYDNIINLKEGE